jgi:alcohol dehydrogenase
MRTQWRISWGSTIRRMASVMQYCCHTFRCSTARLRRLLTARKSNGRGWQDDRQQGAQACIVEIRARKVNIPAGLRELNVKEEDIPVLATNALKDAWVH